MSSRNDAFEAIESQAAQWLVKLDRDKSSATRKQHEAWLAQDTRHRVAHVRLALAWQRADVLMRRLRPLDSRVDPNLLHRKPWIGSQWTGLRRPLAVCGGVLVVLVAVSALILGGSPTQAYSTGIGGLEHVVLEDGSTVELNTSTRILVRFTKSRRQVMLDHGEALFNVAHDSKRPFDVRTDDIGVRAVGTRFAVRLREHDVVEAMVKEGRVMFLQERSLFGLPRHAGVKPSILAAGSRAVAEGQKVSITNPGVAEIERRLMWTEHKMFLKGESLAETVKEMNRYSLRQLAISDSRIEGMRLGGVFSNSDPDGFADALRPYGIRKSETAATQTRDVTIQLRRE